jgi:hypothetical protein
MPDYGAGVYRHTNLPLRYVNLDADREYYGFCMRFWRYYQDAPERERAVKRLDDYLLWGHYHMLWEA